jgi:hypothetical protein
MLCGVVAVLAFAPLPVCRAAEADGPCVPAPAAASAVDAKLDQVLNKLEDMDRRLKKLEEAQAAVELPELQFGDGICEMVEGIATLLGVSIEYSDDPNRRVRELLQNSEDLRQIEEEWERIWFSDQEPQPSAEEAGVLLDNLFRAIISRVNDCLGIEIPFTAKDPTRRIQELLHTGDSSGQIQFEGRNWYTDTPSHLTPERVHGGIQ